MSRPTAIFPPTPTQMAKLLKHLSLVRTNYAKAQRAYLQGQVLVLEYEPIQQIFNPNAAKAELEQRMRRVMKEVLFPQVGLRLVQVDPAH